MYWRRRIALVLALAALGGIGYVLLAREDPAPHVSAAATPGPLPTAGPAPFGGQGTAPSPLAVRLDDPNDTVRMPFKHPPRAGLMFDLNTGRVLWRRKPS